jgi:anti-sigma B factor antagonist
MINIEKRDKIEVVSFTVDKINALITDQLKDEIKKVFENGNSKVVINLKGVNYVDSSGFGCLLSLLKIARNNYCVLKFASPEPPVMQVLQTLHLHTVFDIYDDLDSCVRSLR